MSTASTPVVLSVKDWNISNIRYMQPKVNDRGAKSVNIISTQTNRSLHISTPLMMTWGIADFVDEKGESDGKFSMSLNFPNDDYTTIATTDFLNKFKDFENQILDDAVKYSESWFGEVMPREVIKHTFYPFLKYSKDKMTKKLDYSKPPSIRVKVPNYNNKWSLEIYDTKGNMIFPCDNENMTPMDFVPKKSNVACVIQCGGVWITPKAFGVTWKVNQIVVKPNEVQSVFGKCHVQLSTDEISALENAVVNDETVNDEEETVPAGTKTEVQDSDGEEEVDPVAEQEEAPATEPVPVPVPAVAPKKVVKKVSAVAPAVVETEEQAPAPVVKKVVKKKVVA
ncbi:MAG: hypothetical protein WCJ33_05380 [Pseudomonadota bacterium]